jgi:hypothetical protein
MENYPENHRARWTNKENTQLYKEIKNNMDLETIADNHKRTIGAIKYKLIRYAIELAETDQTLSIYDLCNKTTLSREDLIEGFDKLKFDYNYMDISVDDNSNENNESNDLIVTMIIKINNKINIITGTIAFYSLAKISIYLWILRNQASRID